MRRRIATIAIMTIVAVCLGVSLREFSGTATANQVAQPALTATKVTKLYTAPGSEVIRDLTVEAFREDGSYVFSVQRHVNAVEGGEQDFVQFRRVLDKRAGRYFMAFPGVSMISSSSDAGMRAPRLFGSPPCGEVSDSVTIDTAPSPSTILGYDVVKRTRTIDPTTSTNGLIAESWLAPGLGCFALRQVLTTNGNVSKTVETISVELGVPDEALFAMPAGYTEASPTEAVEELLGRRGVNSAPFLGPLSPVQVETNRYYERGPV